MYQIKYIELCQYDYLSSLGRENASHSRDHRPAQREGGGEDTGRAGKGREVSDRALVKNK
jgi:hypothetical protein